MSVVDTVDTYIAGGPFLALLSMIKLKAAFWMSFIFFFKGI